MAVAGANAAVLPKEVGRSGGLAYCIVLREILTEHRLNDTGVVFRVVTFYAGPAECIGDLEFTVNMFTENLTE